MKTIVFVRHAKSSWDDFRLTDFERPLDARGTHDAPMMAKKLKKEGIHADIIYSSPAVRALTTAQYFASEFGLKIRQESNLYHGFPQHYLGVIQSLKEDISGVMLFGHNPGLTHVANEIERGCIDNLPTCGIVIAQASESLDWQDVDYNKMKLVKILYPKMFY
jgi:phosphohistidine phosphatase